MMKKYHIIILHDVYIFFFLNFRLYSTLYNENGYSIYNLLLLFLLRAAVADNILYRNSCSLKPETEERVTDGVSLFMIAIRLKS